MRFAWIRCLLWISALIVAGAGAAPSAGAQEPPYFVAYGQAMEEPGNLEINFNATYGTQRGGNDYMAYWTEFEYGATGWWTTEFYLDGQSTFHDSSVFTGFRWENRFHPLMKQHWINPVLYVEYENTKGSDKTMKEVVGFDGQDDFLESNAEVQRLRARTRDQNYPGKQFQGLGRFGEFHRGEKFGARAVGIRLRGGCKPVAAAGGYADGVHILPREFCGGRGDVRRPGHGFKFHAERDVALFCADTRVAVAQRLESANFTYIWADRREPWLYVALWRVV